ncbi:MAG: hypothetical protein SFX74_11735 [Fimbriimonadaceae bacterium]|nr:hypothetical protein [Fimbriimonadaceae bacterium]
MQDAASIWKETLPTVLHGVTGRGVWAALNATVPITLEDGTLVLGVPQTDVELAGHLRMQATQRLIEVTSSKVAGTALRVRVIDGTSPEDYERAKRRDAERRRLQDAEMTKLRAEMEARNSWDSVYDQLSRRYAAITNKSLPQNRARFYEEAVGLVAQARMENSQHDELGERTFARCLERIAQYADIGSTIVALDVLRKTGEL